MKKEGILHSQLIHFFTLFFYSTFVGFFSVQLIAKSRYDALLVVCIGGLAGWAYAYCAIKLSSRRPDQFIVHYGKEIFPKWIHVFLMVILLLFCLHNSAIILREYEDFMAQTYLPETPIWAIGIMFAIVIAIMARMGAITLFRAGQGLFFLILTAFLLNNIFTGSQLTLERAMAFVTNHSLRGIFEGSFLIIPFFGQVIILVFIFPLLSKKEKVLKPLIWSIVIGVFIIIVNIAYLLMLFGPHLASHLTYPMMELIRYIRIANFIENLDPILIAVWSTMVFLKISLFFYLSALILAQLFGLKDHKPFTFSLAAVMVAMSLNMSVTSASTVKFFEESWSAFAYFAESIPLMYLLMDTIKRYAKKRGLAKSP